MKPTARILLLAAWLLGSIVVPAGATQPSSPAPFDNPSTTVFINEIHYDNGGTDAGEAIEIAGPAGTDLTGWSLVLYNRDGGSSYATLPLSGSLADQSNGYGVQSVAAAGLETGIALANGSEVVQFLSYEGTFTAVDGPASGLTSTDIGTAEAGSEPLGQSLQLTGAGLTYGDFTWSAPISSTFGAVNSGQSFGTPPPTATPTEIPTEAPTEAPTETPTETPTPTTELLSEVPPVLNEFSASTVGTDVEYIEIFGQAGTDYSAYTILEIEGDTTGSGIVDEVIAVGSTDAAGLWLGSLPAGALENGTLSLVLVRDFTGALNADLDTNNDGVFDVTPWSLLADTVAVSDAGAGDLTYGSPTLGPNYDGLSTFAPGGASRIPDGFDTDAASDWVRNDFDLAGIPGFTGSPTAGEALNTPGAPNAVFVPPPVVMACGGPLTALEGFAASLDVSATDADGTVIDILINGITPLDPGTISLSGLVPAGGVGGTATATVNVAAATPPGSYSVQITATNNDGTPQTGTCSLAVIVVDILPIGAVQGSVADADNGLVHRSAYAGSGNSAGSTVVAVQAVIFEKTLARTSSGGLNRGLFLQNTAATADADPNTSDGLFVFMGSSTTINIAGGGTYTPQVGDEIILSGRVSEFFNLSQLSAGLSVIQVVRSGVDLDAELPAFDVNPPDNLADANRYWERHEGMRAQVPAGSIVIDSRDVFASTADGEFWVARGDSEIAQRADPYERRAFRDP
ncbi:MAG TPA: hypothetical protein VFI11_04155, partial [Anaerolineales bacterium]|nr:hypothetical protein [Anaerolineales bacterium]